MATTKATPAKDAWNRAVEDKQIRSRQMGRPITASQAASAVEKEQPALRKALLAESNSQAGYADSAKRFK